MLSGWHDAAAATTVTPLMKKLTKGDRRDASSMARAKAASAEFNGAGKIADGAQPGAAPGGIQGTSARDQMLR